jgi:hypothetical protein
MVPGRYREAQTERRCLPPSKSLRLALMGQGFSFATEPVASPVLCLSYKSVNGPRPGCDLWIVPIFLDQIGILGHFAGGAKC